jgi:hypothetical protein
MRSTYTALAMAAMTAPLLLGCGAEEAVNPVVAGLPADFTGPGVYTVPADPTVPFAIAHVDVYQEGGAITVYYELPADFFADAPQVELTGTPDDTGTFHLTGGAGTSTCTVGTTVLQCDEHLFGVQFDAAQAKAALPPSDPRAAAVEAFLEDPIGVLRVTLPGSAETP